VSCVSLSSNMIRRTKFKRHFGEMHKTFLDRDRIYGSGFYSNYFFFLFFFLFEAILGERNKNKDPLSHCYQTVLLFSNRAHMARNFFFFEKKKLSPCRDVEATSE
jgi:hypothetical protein